MFSREPIQRASVASTEVPRRGSRMKGRLDLLRNVVRYVQVSATDPFETRRKKPGVFATPGFENCLQGKLNVVLSEKGLTRREPVVAS